MTETDRTRHERIMHERKFQDGLPVPEAEVYIDIDEETYEQLREEYERCVDDGYSEAFNVFVFNCCETDYQVTVGGEPVLETPLDADGQEGQ